MVEDGQNQMSKSGIHIKKSHEGMFTKQAKSAGMDVQEFARDILSGKKKGSKATKKRAVFAKNAKKWKH